MSGPAPVAAAAGPEPGSAYPPKEWPSSPARYWALFAIIFATFVTFFDQAVFGMLAERIKTDFGLTDGQLGFIGGPAAIICYLFVGIPLARLADIWPRKYVLSGGIAAVGLVTALGGLAQNFVQFVGSRVFLAAGGSAHAPASYSLIADAFPPKIITRAFALLQFGFIGGVTLGPIVGGLLVAMTADWEPSYIFGLRILGWQWILIWIGAPALLASLLFLTVKEPQRQPPVADVEQPPAGASFGRQIITFMGWDAAKAIHANGRVYYPLFAALALSATETFGLAFWRIPFMARTFGWNEGQIGPAIGLAALIGSLAGLLLGSILVELLGKRYRDANVRAAFICFCGTTVSTLAALLAPSAWGSIIAFGFAGMFGLAGAVPQNAAIQRVAPNSMRGQVTAFYLFMFTFFGAMGSFVIGLVAQYIFVDPQRLREALLLTASILLPLACFLMFRAMKPYREEIERLEQLEKISEPESTTYVKLRNERTGEIKAIKVGWSWPLFFFSGFFGIPLFLRGLHAWGGVMVALGLISIWNESLRWYDWDSYGGNLLLLFLTSVGLSIFLAIRGNEMTAKAMLDGRWVFAEPDHASTKAAKAQWSLA